MKYTDVQRYIAVQASANDGALHKTALQSISSPDIPQEWKKYLTPRERQSFADAAQRLVEVDNSNESTVGLLVGAVPHLVATPFSLLAAAVTPSYTTEDLEELGADRNFVHKSAWVPGYFNYKALKVRGALKRYMSEIRKRRDAEVQKQKLSTEAMEIVG